MKKVTLWALGHDVKVIGQWHNVESVHRFKDGFTLLFEAAEQRKVVVHAPEGRTVTIVEGMV